MNRLKLLSSLTVLFLLFPVFPSCAKVDKAHDLEIALLGDSMTWIGGDDFSNPCGWTYHFVKLLDSRGVKSHIRSYARSGATWTNTINTQRNPEAYSEILDDDNVIFNQTLRLVKDSVSPDFVVIFAGTNDAWFSKSRPGLLNKGDVDHLNEAIKSEPSQFTTLESSVKLVCNAIRDAFPGSEILLVTPPYSRKIPEDRIEKVSDGIESVANRYGIRCLRGDRIFDFKDEGRAGNIEYTTDGVHTNPAGASRIAREIYNNITIGKAFGDK